MLFVGVLRYYKGLRYLLEAMQSVPARLLIVGEGPEGPALRQTSDALGLAEKVVFAGAVTDSELPAYYGAASVFCLPASERSEAFGLVQLEALAVGGAHRQHGTGNWDQLCQSSMAVRVGRAGS